MCPCLSIVHASALYEAGSLTRGYTDVPHRLQDPPSLGILLHAARLGWKERQSTERCAVDVSLDEAGTGGVSFGSTQVSSRVLAGCHTYG